MSSDLFSYRLGDISDVQTGPFGSQLHKSDYCEKGIPIITVEHLGEKRFSYESIPQVNAVDYLRLKKYSLKTGDMVFSRVGSVDRCSYVSNDENGWLFSGRCLRVRPTSTKINPIFLYYYFCQERVKEYIRNIAVGATMPSINTKILSDIFISIPKADEQKAIADILSCLDDKIELNNRMNKILEEMAQAIFKSWFVEYEPFHDGEFVDSEIGMVPNGWEINNLEKIIEVTSGYSYKGTDLQDSTCAMLTIKNFDRNGSFKVDGFKTITISERVKPKHYVQLFDVLVAHTDITQKADIIGNPILVLVNAGYEKMVFSMDLVKVSSRLKQMSNVVIYLLLSDDRFKKHALGYASGTTVIHLSKKALPAYRLAFPTDEKIILKLSSIVDPLFQFMGKNINENAKLSQLRDTLLPKLMSGEIRVPVQEE